MQVCELCDLLKTKRNERVNKEYQTSPDAVCEIMAIIVNDNNYIYMLLVYCSL